MGKESAEKVRERVTKYRQKKKVSGDLQSTVTQLQADFVALQKDVTILRERVMKLENSFSIDGAVRHGLVKNDPKSLFEKVIADKLSRLGR